MTPDQASAIVEAVREAARSGTEGRITVRDWARELLETVDLPYWPREALLWDFPEREEQTSPPLRWNGRDEQESIAFDLAFDPSQMCAVCVSALNPLNAMWRVKAFAPNGALMNLENVRTTARWALELIERGGRIETPNGNTLLMRAAGLYRGTPLCEYDLTPAIMGHSAYKF